MSGHEPVVVTGITGLPEIRNRDALGKLIASRAELMDGDVVVISQKVVSKAEGRVLRLDSVRPGPEAERIAAKLGKDPRLVELVLSESDTVLRSERGVLITRTRHGFVCANAGVDTSNLAESGTAALLPLDPDESARRIRRELVGTSGARTAVIVSDSFGRAWRLGQCEVAIGCAGIAPLDDWRGRTDANGSELSATVIAVADQAAAAADLVRDKDSKIPAAVVRGLARFVGEADGPGAVASVRPLTEDLFS